MKTILRIIGWPFKWVALEIFATVFMTVVWCDAFYKWLKRYPIDLVFSTAMVLLIWLDSRKLLPDAIDQRLSKHFE